MKRTYFLLVFLLASYYVSAQKAPFERIMYGGIQFKPIFPNEFLQTGSQSVDSGITTFTISPKFSYTFGFSLNHVLSKSVSMDYGLLLTKRKYELNIKDTAFNRTSQFETNGFEVPVLLRVSIPLSKQLQASTAWGINFNLTTRDYSYPYVRAVGGDTYFKNYVARRFTVNPGIMGNIGFQYETKNGSAFYLGGSFNLPFFWTYKTYLKNMVEVPPFTSKGEGSIYLRGSYLTLDLRYYFIKESTDYVKRHSDEAF